MKHTATFFCLFLLSFILFAQDEGNAPEKNTNTVIRLRCGMSILAAEPLYLLDGELISSSKIKTLHPELIESITVLKESAALSLYGSRGYNGVVLIKSKPRTTPRFLVLDAVDGSPVPAAFINLVEEGRSDTIRLVAGNKGEITMDGWKTGRSYKVIISSVGYQTKTFDYTHLKPGSGYDFLLERNEVSLPTVSIISSQRIICKRAVSCKLVTTQAKEPNTFSLENRIESSAVLARAYPNPLRRGATLTVEFTNEEEQAVDLRLFSLSGQSMRRNVARLNKGVNRISIDVGSHWPAGSYVVQLIDRKGQMLLQQKLVIE